MATSGTANYYPPGGVNLQVADDEAFDLIDCELSGNLTQIDSEPDRKLAYLPRLDLTRKDIKTSRVHEADSLVPRPVKSFVGRLSAHAGLRRGEQATR
jgi:hypothetical protein